MRLLVIILISFGWTALCFAEDRMAQDIRNAALENLEARQSEDMDRLMDVIHPESPNYQTFRQQMIPLFDNYDLEYELLSFRFIGLSDGYALVRTRHRTIKNRGPAFQDNDVDLIQVYKKDGDRWKYWSKAVLEINHIQ